MPVVGIGKLGPEWLVQSADNDQQGFRTACGVVVQAAEQPVMMTAGTIDTDLDHRVISPFIASQYPPPANFFGGADATWARTALIVARTLGGQAPRNSLPGIACPGSSSLCLRKNATSCASSEDGRVRTC